MLLCNKIYVLGVLTCQLITLKFLDRWKMGFCFFLKNGGNYSIHCVKQEEPEEKHNSEKQRDER